MKKIIISCILVFGAVSPLFAFADHSVTHTLDQIKQQISALEAQLKALKASEPSGVSIAPAVTFPTVEPKPMPPIGTVIVPPVFDDDTSDDDIVQLNNLRIQSVSSPTRPAIIAAAYDSGIRCLKFESETSARGLSIPCPVSPSYLYQIRVNEDTVLLLRNRQRAGLAQFEIGDRINIYGFRDRDTGAIDGLIVRNLDKPAVKRFIQLNSVEVTEAASPLTPPAILVVVQKPSGSGCVEFEGGGSVGKGIACPLGLEVLQQSPQNQVKSEVSPPYYPRPRQYFIEVTSQTQISQRDRNPMSLKDIQVGDILNIYGVERQDRKTIEALVIRDISVPKAGNTGTLQVIVNDAELMCPQLNVFSPSSYYPPTYCGILYDATVEVYDNQGRLVGKQRVGERGSVIFENLSLGEYTVVASTPGYKNGRQQAVIDQPGRIHTFPMALFKEGITSTNLPPTIYGVKGPTTLKIGEVGTWSVSASDPENGVLNYSVLWGDELLIPGIQGGDLIPQAPFVQTATFTHAYSQSGAGTYTPIFTVMDDKGLTAKSSVSVMVGEIGMNIPVYEASPSGTLVRGQTYDFRAKITNAAPNAQVLFYLQRPDGTMKYNGQSFGFLTDANGTASGDTKQFITNEGQNGGWNSWVSVGGMASNKQYYYIQGSGSSSITVVSPNGGEVWLRGSTQTLNWKAQSVSKVAVFLRSVEKTNLSYTVGVFSGSVSAYGWLVGNIVDGVSLPDGQYRIRVSGMNSNGAEIAFDESDAPFSIVSTSLSSILGELDTNFSRVGYTTNYSLKTSTGVIPMFISANAIITDSNGNTLSFSDLKSGMTVKALGSKNSYFVDAWDISSIQVVSAVNQISIISPNGGEQFVQGTNIPISWKTVNLPGNTIYVHLYLSPSVNMGIDGSITAVITCSGAIFSPTSSFTWNGKTICANGKTYSLPAGKYQIVARLYSWPNQNNPGIEIASDTSDAAFSIAAPVFYPGFVMKTDKSSYSPNDTVSLTLSRADGRADSYAVDLYAMKSDGGSRVVISSNLQVGQNTVAKIQLNLWSVFSQGGAGQYLLATCPAGCIYGSDGNTNSTVIELTAVSTQSSITILSPNGGKQWQAGSQQTIRWSGGSDNTGIYLYNTLPNASCGYCNFISVISSGVAVSQGQFVWNIPASLAVGNTYYIRLSGGATADNSDAPFSITTPTFYPGFVMKTDKSLYSLNDTVSLTLSRADGRTDLYPVDIYAMKSDVSNKALIYSNLQVGQNTVTKVQLNAWSLFTQGGAGQYLLATCPAGCIYGSDGNTNSMVIELTAAQSKLVIRLALAYAPPTVIAGSVGAELNRYWLEAPAGQSDIIVPGMWATFSAPLVPSTSYSLSNLMSCQLFDGIKALNTGSNVVNPYGTGARYLFTFDSAMTVKSGVIKELVMKCNIVATTPDGSIFKVGLDIGAIKTVFDATSGKEITPEVIASNGPSVTVQKSGVLSATLDSSTPSARDIEVGISNVEMLRAKFVAVGETMNMTELWIHGTGVSDDVSAISFYDGTTQIGKELVQSGTSIAVRIPISSGMFQVPIGGSKVLSVRADVSSKAQVGRTLALSIQSGKAVGAISATQVSLSASNVTGAAMKIVAAAIGSTSAADSNLASVLVAMQAELNIIAQKLKMLSR